MRTETVAVTSRTVTRHFAERVVPSLPADRDVGGEEEYHTQRKGFASVASAWLWVARGALFRAREKRCYCKRLKAEYRGAPSWDGGPGQCRYCDQEQWRPVVARLARIMRHRAESKSGRLP